jgi:hypothetical protein
MRCARPAIGLRTDAELFAARILRRVAQRKPAALSIAVDLLGIPHEEVRLLYLDPRNSPAKQFEVPATST